MKRVFIIEYPDDAGPLWINTDNLMLCLTTNTHCKNTNFKIQDITDDEHDFHVLEHDPFASPARKIHNPEDLL